MRIYLATDHAGFRMKEALKPFLDELGYEVQDCGAYEFDEGDDYPDHIAVAVRETIREVEKGQDTRAIVLGGSGQGEAMCANRFPGIRATVYYGGDEEIITLAREHNNANVLSLGARFLSEDEAKKAVKKWLETSFSGDERHTRRIEKLG